MYEVISKAPPKVPSTSWLTQLLIVSLAVLPLIHSKTAIYGTIVHRTLFFRAIVDAMMLIMCLRWKNKTIAIEKSPLTISILLYTIIVLISDLAGEDVRLNLFSNFERMMGFVNLIHLVGFYFFFSRVRFNRKQWGYFFIVLTLTGIYMCLFGLLEQNKFADKRIQSLLSNPMHLSGYLLTFFFLLLLAAEHIVLTFRSHLSKIGFIGIVLTIVLLIYTLFLTKTRSGVLALAVGILVTIIAAIAQYRSIRNWLAAVLVIGLLIPAILCIQRDAEWVQNNDILNRVTDLSIKSKTVGTRLNLWKMTLGGINDRPILGWGQESFPYFYAKHYTPNLHGAGFWYDSSHNFVLDKIVQTGWAGLLAYLLVIIAFYHAVWQRKNTLSKWQKSVLSGYLAAYLVFLSFGFDSLVSLIGFLGLAAYVTQNTPPGAYFSATVGSVNGVKFLISGLILFAFWQFAVRSLITNRQMTNAYNQNEIEEMISQHEQAYQQAFIGKYDVVIQYALKHDQVFQSGLPIDVKNRYAQSANAMLTNALHNHPDNSVLLAQAGFVQFSGISHSLGIETYRKLATIAPQRQVNLLDLGIFYLQDNQFDKALAVFDQVDKLDTTFQVPVIYKAYLLMKQNRVEEGIRLLKTVDVSVWVEYMHVLRVMFSERNRLKELAAFINQTSFDDRIVFRQNTYLMWAQIGAALNDKVQIRTAYNSYANHYLKNHTLKNEKELIQECVNLGIQASEGKIPVETMMQYFAYFPSQ